MKQQIQNVENFYQESKEFLKKIKNELESVGDNNPCGIVFSAADGEGKDRQTVLYEKSVYVIVVPEGKKEDALLYGNWDEALFASKRFLMNNLAANPQVSIQFYTA